jgi:hypothetical protein
MLVYHSTDSGAAPYARLNGCFPAADGQGNVYFLAFPHAGGCGASGSSIAEYSPDAVGGTPIRSLPVGPLTNIASVQDMAVSSTGEIFVNDGQGVAVFSATANGSDAPVRYIKWDSGGQIPVTPGFITVDNRDNLYVQHEWSIAVFGPNETGLVVPSRVISGLHTQLVNGIGRMTTDVQGDLYVAIDNGGWGGVGVLEFAADANGDIAPLRSVTSTSMSNFSGFIGVAVDSAGLIYVRATDPYCPTVFVFGSNASGSADALRVMGQDCLDTDGTVAVF